MKKALFFISRIFCLKGKESSSRLNEKDKDSKKLNQKGHYTKSKDNFTVRSKQRDLTKLQKLISYSFTDQELLNTALTHSSVERTKNGNNKTIEYERMEFFGDAVLGLVTVEYLFNKHPDKSEGDLSKLKSNIVSENYLSVKARLIDLGSYIRLGDDEFRTKGFDKKSILANMMESLICSIYIDGGLKAAREFISSYILKGYEKELLSEIHINYKSILQEHCQSEYQKLPDYKIVSTQGPDHKKTFTVVVTFNKEKLGSGEGLTKKAAEQNAAKEACAKLKI